MNHFTTVGQNASLKRKALFGFLFLSLVAGISCTKKKDATVGAGGLKKEVLKAGSGTKAEAGKTVVVHYTGWLTDGKKFDSSVDRGQPFTFTLGQGMVIKGWDEGVQGMTVGEKVKLTIPPDMAYGDRGIGPIPPNSTLVFEVELLEVK